MSLDSLNFIIQNLNSPPFNCNTSLIAFDLWSPTTLLQQLSDVISWITQTDNVDVTKETPDETALRLLYYLKILKFNPPTDIDDLEEWRSGLVEGAKRSVYPVLFYIFSNVEILKQRAYLAKYLVKVEIPSDVHDMDTAQMQNDLAQLMEKFKDTHARVLDVQQDSMLIDDIKSDIKSMVSEKEVLSRKIEKALKKIENLPNLDRQVAAATELRVQRNRLSELDLQRLEQRDGVIRTEKKIQRLREQLTELRVTSENLDPSNLIAQLEDEITTITYLLNEKLTAEREQKEKIVAELSNVSNMPAIDQSDIAKLQAELNAKTSEIMELEKERDKSEENTDENFSIFRHQASNVERRKEAAAQRVQEARQELARLQQQVEQKKLVLRNTTGAEVMSAHQFKLYVNRIRDKKVLYKNRKSQIEELITEREVLLRTIDLLTKKFEQLKEKIESFGGEVVEYSPATTVVRSKTAPSTTDTDELRNIITNLMQTIDRRRDQMGPLVKRHDDLQETFNRFWSPLSSTTATDGRGRRRCRRQQRPTVAAVVDTSDRPSPLSSTLATDRRPCRRQQRPTVATVVDTPSSIPIDDSGDDYGDKNEESIFRSKQAEHESRSAKAESGCGVLEPLISSLEQREEDARTAVPKIEQEISEAESQLSQFDGDGFSDEKIKDQIAEEQQQAESLSQRYGNDVIDVNASRKQMQMWKSLVTMFEAKIAIANKESGLEDEHPIGD
ncbi:hypothetical protein Y032_0179g700 [Ancylostoma ceylanicum]|uniref:Intraflagellar transport protein 81 homolog n=1 Tax=Ancylostoma ceylanicum TaxID=53326 RepID=A0A016ST19_9BILA|nr:hypothetical protein Y032_0179g700 [Ancylostoma ceylanicum]